MSSSHRFLNWDRLVQYDGLMKNWVLSKITEAGGMTEEQVRALFVEMFKAAKESGVANDIRTYESILNFPLLAKIYKASTGKAVAGVDYYQRSGSGTQQDPYVYTKVTVEVGESVEGLYERDFSHLYTEKWDSSYTGTVPTIDVEYVDGAAHIEYIWKQIDSSDYSGEYIMVNQTASKGDIENIFN